MLYGADAAGGPRPGDVEVVVITREQAEEIAERLGIEPVPTEEEAMALVDHNHR